MRTQTHTAPKAAAEAPESDVWAAAEEAADGFMAALKEAIELLPQPPDLDQPTATLRAALERLRPGAAKPVLRATARTLEIPGARRPDFTPHPDAVRAHARAGLTGVLQVLDEALTRFERQPELDEAEQTVARLEAEHRAVLRDLESAVATADVPAVMRLRPRVEVELPAALDGARLTVADLLVQRAESLRARQRRRLEGTTQAEARARADLKRAQERLQAAARDADTAVRDTLQAKQLVSMADAEARDLKATRDRLAEENKISMQDRLRHLAGLPPENVKVEREPAETPPAAGRITWGRPRPYGVLAS